MTTPSGDIYFNDGVGTDSAASGLGPASAVSGSGASTTSGSAVVTGISTTGVSAGDLLFVQASSGRKFSIISSVDSGTQVTCDNTFSNTESGRNWAIGGKRATFDDSDSRQLFQDAATDWTVITETDQDLTGSDLIINPANDVSTAEQLYFTVKGDSLSSLRTIDQAAADHVIVLSGTGRVCLENLKLTCSNGSRASYAGLALSASSQVIVENCYFGDATDTLGRAVVRAGGTPIIVAKNCTAANVNPSSSSWGIFDIYNGYGQFYGCLVTGSDGVGFRFGGGRDGIVDSCVVYDGNYGITTNGRAWVSHSVFDNNTLDGISIGGSRTRVMNCILSNNGGYGITGDATGDAIVDWCNYYSNTSGARNNIMTGKNDLAVNPEFVDAANGDFTLGSSSLLQLGFPRQVGVYAGSRNSYRDFGAVQASGSGGSTVIVVEDD